MEHVDLIERGYRWLYTPGTLRALLMRCRIITAMLLGTKIAMSLLT